MAGGSAGPACRADVVCESVWGGMWRAHGVKDALTNQGAVTDSKRIGPPRSPTDLLSSHPAATAAGVAEGRLELCELLIADIRIRGRSRSGNSGSLIRRTACRTRPSMRTESPRKSNNW